MSRLNKKIKFVAFESAVTPT